jgi:hypothetical protein
MTRYRQATRPTVGALTLDSIPLELCETDRWAVWRFEPKQDVETGELDWDKVPYQARNIAHGASSTGPRTWASFAAAMTTYRKGGFDGLVFALGDGWAAGDFDEVVDEQTGETQDEWEIEARAFRTYVEFSPSGKGLRVLLHAAESKGLRYKLGNIEAYDHARFITITGHHLAGTPATVEPRQAELDAFRSRHLPVRVALNGHQNGVTLPSMGVTLEDEALLAKARSAENGAKIAALLDGELLGYPSKSEARGALLFHLTFYSSDPAQLDRLMRQSPIVDLAKWERLGAREIEDALALVTETYTPGRNGASPEDTKDAEDEDEDEDRDDDDDDDDDETGYVDADPAPPAEGGNFAGPSPEVRPFVQLNDVPLRTKIDQTMAALLAANTPKPSVFVRGGALARFRWNEQGQPVIDPLGEAALRGYMTRVAEFVTTTKTGYSHKDPPVELSRVLVAAGSWPGLPPLVGIVEAPTLRPDGTLLDRPGYDLSTGLIYAPAPGLVVPEIPTAPTAADVADSVRVIERELLHDFPFCAPADKAHAWAVLLTPIVRAAIAGCVPLLLLDAPKAGTGKTLLAGVSAVIATGRKAEVMTAPAHDEAEWRKKLTTILREHATIVLIDNLPDVLKSAQLAAVLTAQSWRDRVLGVSQSVTLPQRATWLATGNNIRLGGDLPRRCVRLRIDAKEARPWQRQPGAFVHADLLGWVKAHRGAVLAALLTVARAWFVAGCPEAPSKTPRALGGFEDWQRVLGGILAYAGIEGFLDNLDELYEQADDDTPQWEAFLLAWRTTFADRAVSVAEVAGRLDVDQKEEVAARRVLLPALPERLADAYGRRRESFGHHLGRALAGQEDTRYGDEHLYVARDGTAKDRKGGVRWQLHVGKPRPPETPA